MAGGCDNEPVRSRRQVRAGWLPGRIRTVIVGLLVLGVGGFLIDGANRPANPYLLPAPGQVREAGSSGFGAVTLSVTRSDGAKRSVCTLEAKTEAQQERGLMGQRSLHGFAGMVFVFPAPTSVLFHMKDTLIPLSLAWFEPGGAYLGSAEMPVCPTGAVCPTYAAGRPFTLAVEVPAGRLGSLGIGPGSSVALGGPCSA